MEAHAGVATARATAGRAPADGTFHHPNPPAGWSTCEDEARALALLLNQLGGQVLGVEAAA